LTAEMFADLILFYCSFPVRCALNQRCLSEQQFNWSYRH